jgi:hypothetical protein
MPYTPTERNRVGELLAQGIGSASQSIAGAIDKRRTESQKATALRKAISLYDETMKDQVQTMGLRDLEGFIAAQGMKQARTAQEQQAKFQAAQLANFEADNKRGDEALNIQRTAQADRQRQMQALAGFAREYGQPAVPGISSPAVLQAAENPGERLRRALANNPGAMTPELMQTLVRYGEEGRPGANPMPLPFEAGGMKGVFSPKTGQFQAERPEPTSKDDVVSVVLERDPDYPDRAIRTWRGTPDQFEKRFGRKLDGPGATGGGEPVPMPKSKDQLKAGQVYQTARGPARWNGNAFEPIQ